MNFELISEYQPTGDQPEAIAQLTEGVLEGVPRTNFYWGVTGSGKTFTIANVIKNINKPTLILSHNKTIGGPVIRRVQEFLFPTMQWNTMYLIMTITSRSIPAVQRHLYRKGSGH